MGTAIKVEGLGKKYVIRHEQKAQYKTLRDELAGVGKKIITRLAHPFNPAAAEPENFEEFWALKDVSFDIEQGDRVGIIGRNGAGKPTLLKVLSRITEPTTGKIHINGRVASLLEVGTGFHPELTGRENIYLNGAILGMSRAEIRKKFDEIVAFAEVEKFLDTPVKRYSSGMYVRLAFSVAAHLEPEILIVDEVLAVGDLTFQKKCLGKMEEVSHEGRTVLFVSHNMSSILQLTNKVIVLNDGDIAYMGETQRGVETYYDMAGNNSAKVTQLKYEDFEVGNFRYIKKKEQEVFNDDLHFSFHMISQRKWKDLYVVIAFVNSLGAKIMTTKTYIPELPIGKNLVELQLTQHHLVPGQYSLEFSLSAEGNLLFIENSFYRLEYSCDCHNEPLLLPHITRGKDKIGIFRTLGINMYHESKESKA